MSEATSWTRETKWRQGSVLSPAAAARLGFVNDRDAAATCVVVVSHDCDLANPDLIAEPDVEVIVGRIVAALNGNFAWGKAPRTYHASATRGDEDVVVELSATKKASIPKHALAAFEPDLSIRLTNLDVLRGWLASRYRRAAFADTFVDRMNDTKAADKLAKVLEKHGAALSFVYFDLDAGRLIERPASEPYEISVVLVYPPVDDPDAAGAAADTAADDVERVLRDCFRDGKRISLKRCFAISEDDIPVSQARKLTQWRLEHITFRAKQPQPGPPKA
jgi:hypothetical protein